MTTTYATDSSFVLRSSQPTLTPPGAAGPAHLKVVRRLDLRHPGYAIAQSQDGAYIVVGMATGAKVFGEDGLPCAIFPANHASPMLIHRVSVEPDFTSFMVGSRAGDLVNLDVTCGGAHALALSERRVYHCDSDLHTFAAPCEEGRIAIGHLKGGIAMVNTAGEVIWRHGRDGTVPMALTWSVDVASDRASVYAGSAGGKRCSLSRLDAANGDLLRHQVTGCPITSVGVLPDDLGVITATPIDPHNDKLMAYSADLGTLFWEKRLSGPLTALAIDRNVPIIALGEGYDGGVTLLDGATGATLAHRKLYEFVNDISIVRGNLISVVTQHCHVITLRYT